MHDVVILCGGQGTRSYPFTEYFPKAMMPVSGTPIIVHLMRIYAAQGFTRFVLAAGHRQEVLADYLEGRFSEWDIKVLDTGKDSDTGERIRRSLPYLGDTFLASYGDGLGNVDLNGLIESHERSGAMASVTAAPLHSQYGTLVFNGDNRVCEFREKPVIEDCWINAGFFVFQRRVFELWQGQNLEVDILPGVAERRMLNAYKHTGFWRSMDTSKDQQQLELLHDQDPDGTPPWMMLSGKAKAKVRCATG